MINEAVNIINAPTREGYVFKGWTKTKGGTSADFLVWTGSGYKSAETNNEATQVAADEKQPYDDLYAVWQPVLQVEITGNTDTKTYNGSACSSLSLRHPESFPRT